MRREGSLFAGTAVRRGAALAASTSDPLAGDQFNSNVDVGGGGEFLRAAK